ncbi:hypothetical protein I544_2178 [Mycobacteroides abscessus subsp. bolletii 103]|nr:hypothetical protein MA4S0206_4447 [Mycobacteroides abscessus 4S-0206]EUA80879.1 hypothetical protein I544_2178 [Mycobacteroides abscessus subsp. bolletii 103]
MAKNEWWLDVLFVLPGNVVSDQKRGRENQNLADDKDSVTLW